MSFGYPERKVTTSFSSSYCVLQCFMFRICRSRAKILQRSKSGYFSRYHYRQL